MVVSATGFPRGTKYSVGAGRYVASGGFCVTILPVPFSDYNERPYKQDLSRNESTDRAIQCRALMRAKAATK